MKRIISLLIAFSFSVSTTFGECGKPVITLNEGEKAPCKGFLFSPAKEQEIRLLDEDYNLLKQEVELKNKTIELLKKDISSVDFMIKKEQEKSELWRSAAELSTKNLVQIQDSKGNRDLLMILTGVLITVGAGYALGQVK